MVHIAPVFKFFSHRKAGDACRDVDAAAGDGPWFLLLLFLLMDDAYSGGNITSGIQNSVGEVSGSSRMNFNSFDEFLAMGGYGLYVWSAYGITLVVFAYNIIRPILMRRRELKQQKQQQKHEQESKNSSEQGAKGLDKRAGELT